MKTAILLVGLLAVASASLDVSFDNDVDQMVLPYARMARTPRGSIENSIMAMAECLRKILQEGGELTGGMILDPLEVDHFEGDLEVPELISGHGAVDNVTVKGLSSFKINKVKVNILGMQVDYDVTLENLHGHGFYEVDGKVANLVTVTGKGPFDIKLDQINVAGFIKLRLTPNLANLDLQQLKMVLKVGGMEFKIDGLMNNPELSELINAVLNDVLPQLIVEQQGTITDEINKLAKEMLNPILNKMTFQDLLDLVNGSGGSGGLSC